MSSPTFLRLSGQPLIYAITLCSGLAFLLFGYDLAFMGGVVGTKQFQSTFGTPNSSLLGFLVSSYEVGCFLGGVLMFIIADKFGRRTICFAGATIISVGALIQCSSFGVGQFLVGRIIAGVGLGMNTTVVPVWLTECARPKSRGRMIGIQLSHLILGLILANWLDFGLQNYTSTFRWRFPCAFQIVICALFVAFLTGLPESPRYLAVDGRETKARYNLAALRGTSEDSKQVTEEMQEICYAVEMARQQSANAKWSDLFHDGGMSGWARVAVAMLANAGQQLTGSNVLSSFGAYVFQQSLHMTPYDALLVSGFLQVWFFFSSIVAWWAVDHIGRRKLFIFGSTGMTSCMALGALFVGLHRDNLAIGAAVVFYLFYTFFTIGWQANMWIYPSELLPLRLRQRGAALCMVVQWLTTFLVVETTPPMIQGIGYNSFTLYACFNLAFIPIVYFFFPETSQLPLEAVDLIFADRDGQRPSITRVVRDSAKKEYRAGLETELLVSAVDRIPERLGLEQKGGTVIHVDNA